MPCLGKQVPIPGAAGKWVNLDVLPKATTVPTSLPGGGLDELKQQVAFWITDQCEFYLLDADKLRAAEEFTSFLTLQEMRKQYPDWIVKRTFDFDRVCNRAYVKEYLALSQCAAARLSRLPLPNVLSRFCSLSDFRIRCSQPLGGSERP